jgi:hypothetical protein
MRLGLGVVELALALAVGDRDPAALLAFALGALAVTVFLASDRRFASRSLDEPAPLPAEAEIIPPLRAALYGLLPSTAGASALALVSLAFEPVLAALLAGVVAGMGIASSASLYAVEAAERGGGGRLYAERRRGRVFIVEPERTMP